MKFAAPRPSEECGPSGSTCAGWILSCGKPETSKPELSLRP